MAEGRRYSFEDARNRRARELEDAFEQQREVFRSGGQVAAIAGSGAGRSSEVHWASAEQRGRFAAHAAEQTAEGEAATREQRAAMNDATRTEASEMSNLRVTESEAVEHVMTAARERIKQTAAAEARRIAERVAASHDEMRIAAEQEAAAFEEATHARLVEAEEALRAQATQTQHDVRRAADEKAAAFDQVAGKRVVELQDVVSEHSELLDELTRLHATTAEQIEEVRSLVVELHEAQERRSDPEPTAIPPVRMVVQGLAPGSDGAMVGSTPDLRGLDHEGRVVGDDVTANGRLADLDRYVERSEASRRAIEERLADLEAEVAESVTAASGSAAGPPPGMEEFEARLRAVADENTRRLEEAGLVTKNQLVDALAHAQDRLAQSADGRASDLSEMIAAARTTIERTANSRVESLESTAVELRDGIEELERDIAAALAKTGEEQSAALDQAARDWLERMKNGDAGKWSGRLRRRAGPGTAAVVCAVVAALGGTMLVRGGGSDRSSVANANPPARRAAPARDAATGNTSRVGQVADALAGMDWPTTTAPLSWRAPPTTPAPAPATPPATATGPPTGGAAAPPTGGGQPAPPARPAPQPPPQTSPPSQPPPPTLIPPITLSGSVPRGL